MGHNSVPALGDLVHEAPDPPISNEIMGYLADWHNNMSVCLAEVTHGGKHWRGNSQVAIGLPFP